jgi:hypothetical protein
MAKKDFQILIIDKKSKINYNLNTGYEKKSNSNWLAERYCLVKNIS